METLTSLPWQLSGRLSQSDFFRGLSEMFLVSNIPGVEFKAVWKVHIVSFFDKPFAKMRTSETRLTCY